MDETYLEYATPRQAEVLRAVWECGGQRAACYKYGWDSGSVCKMLQRLRSNAARQGYDPPNGLNIRNPPGYITGKVTVQQSGDTVERVWKRMSPDAAAAQERLEELADYLAERTEGLAPPVTPPAETLADQLVVYPLFDEHFGLYAWKPEAGEHFDLDIAETRLGGGIDSLISSVPPASTGLIVNGGDWYHTQDSTNRTPESKNALDVDGRFTKVFDVGKRAMIHCIDRARGRHAKVVIYFVPGNHDPELTPVLASVIDAYYRHDERVEVVISPALYQYYRFGQVLLGFHHGHRAKPADLPIIMANDRREDWGATQYQYWYTGHIHHRTAYEYGGVIVESFRTPASKDAWTAGAGYRSGKDMQAIVHHRDYGEVERRTCSLAMIEA